MKKRRRIADKFTGSLDKLFIKLFQQGWAKDNACLDGLGNIVTGESKTLLENTDGGIAIDIFDLDNDDDGTSDGNDSLIDDSDPPGTAGHGKPDWWEKKHPGK